MITVRDRIEAIVEQSPFMREALADGLINVSSLARRIHPQVETDLRKRVTVDAVFMALKRYASSLESSAAEFDPRNDIGELSLRTRLFQLTIANSERLMSTVSAALTQTRPTSSSVLIFTKTMHEMTITASDALRDDIGNWLQNERITWERDGITALSLQRIRKTDVVGALQYPLQVLAWNGIVVIDVVSTTNEMMMLLNDVDVDQAVSVLRRAMQDSPKEGSK